MRLRRPLGVLVGLLAVGSLASAGATMYRLSEEVDALQSELVTERRQRVDVATQARADADEVLGVVAAVAEEVGAINRRIGGSTLDFGSLSSRIDDLESSVSNLRRSISNLEDCTRSLEWAATGLSSYVFGC